MKNKCLLVFAMFSFLTPLAAQDLVKTSHRKTAAYDAESFRSVTFDGGWCWFSDPRAVYFEGKHKRTYTGWIDSYGAIHIAYYDHDTHEIKSKVLYDKLETDDHDNPVILIGAVVESSWHKTECGECRISYVIWRERPCPRGRGK